MKTIKVVKHPSVYGSYRKAKPVREIEATVIRETTTTLTVWAGDVEVKLSKTTGREVGVNKFASHYAMVAS